MSLAVIGTKWYLWPLAFFALSSSSAQGNEDDTLQQTLRWSSTIVLLLSNPNAQRGLEAPLFGYFYWRRGSPSFLSLHCSTMPHFPEKKIPSNWAHRSGFFHVGLMNKRIYPKTLSALRLCSAHHNESRHSFVAQVPNNAMVRFLSRCHIFMPSVATSSQNGQLKSWTHRVIFRNKRRGGRFGVTWKRRWKTKTNTKKNLFRVCVGPGLVKESMHSKRSGWPVLNKLTAIFNCSPCVVLFTDSRGLVVQPTTFFFYFDQNLRSCTWPFSR